MKTSEDFYAQQWLWINPFNLGNNVTFIWLHPQASGKDLMVQSLFMQLWALDSELISHIQPDDATVETFVVPGNRNRVSECEMETTQIF